MSQNNQKNILRKTVLSMVILTVAMTTNGCTVLLRGSNGAFGSKEKLGLYPGTRADICLIARTPIGVVQDGPFYLPCVAYWAADLPISATIDTCLLPMDLKEN